MFLLIEIADSSRDLELGEKARLYAFSGIQDYWALDVNECILIVHRAAAGDRYASIPRFDRDSTVSPQAFPEDSLHLAEIFRPLIAAG